jgi:RecB family exonuclease
MNRLLEGLAALCETHRLEEKILISPSRAIGHQIAEALVRAGHPWVNLRVETVHTLAHGMIRDDLAEAGLGLVSRAQALALIEQICSQTLAANDYFGRLKEQPGFHRALRQTLEDVRNAEVSPAHFRTEPFDDKRKADNLSAIVKAYETALAESQFIDSADVLRRAREKVRKGARPASGEAIYLVPDNLDLSLPARDFLEGAANGRLQVFATDDLSGWKPSKDSVRVFHALGEENEVREVFRRLLGDGIELDRVEILYTDGTTYRPLIYEMSTQYQMPCTYAEGIPVVFSRSGRAALGYLDWLDSGYDANALRQLIGADIVDLRKFAREGETAGAVGAARILRDAGIGWGRDRHLPRLDALIKAYSECQRASEKEDRDTGSLEFQRRQVTTARMVRSTVQHLLDITPETEADGKLVLSGLARGTGVFVREFARIGDELDGMASRALQALFDELSTLPAIALTPSEAIKRLKEAIRTTYVGSSTPKPGHLHVSDCYTGGYSGREVTFILGMNESYYPGPGLQDPVLLDRERKGINRIISPRRLPLVAERPEENKQAFRICLARLRGQITLSYSCRNLLEDREQFPSPMVLEIYRSINKMPAADYSAMRSTLGEPAGFIPSRAICLDETEWWLRQVRESEMMTDKIPAFARAAYPWLERGWHAEQERSSNRFTVFDGWVKDCRDQLDPRCNRAAISCTHIETLARCPFTYFLRYVLQIERPEDWARDPTLWLNPTEFGSLLHEVFRVFMVELRDRNERPSFPSHWARLKAIAGTLINQWKRRIPPPNTAAFARQRNQVLLTCRTFLKNEEIHCQRVRPQYFEVPFGVAGVESSLPIGGQTPVSIELGEGTSFLLRGYVDRIDHAGGDDYEVWDYKSGNPRFMREEKLLNRGRQIQHALYARAVEILLARFQRRGRVQRSGYFFPGPSAAGERIVYMQDTVALGRVLNALFDLLYEGVFPYAPDSDFCRFCEFEGVCGGREKVNERSTVKLKNRIGGNTVLEPYRRLVGCDD